MKKIFFLSVTLGAIGIAHAGVHEDYKYKPNSPELSILYFEDDARYEHEGIMAAKSIMNNTECVGVTREVDISMFTGASFSKGQKISLKDFQKSFKTKTPEITNNTRFYFLNCKTPQGLLDNFYIRAEDIGKPEKVWRLNGNPARQ